MGIIRSLKALYRTSMISRMISHLDSDTSITVTQLTRQVNILDAIHMSKVAWSGVKQESVTNCFAKAGFVTPITLVEEEALDPPDGMSSYVDFDVSLECHGQLTEEDICAQILQKNDSTETSQQDSDDDQDDHTLASCSAALTPKCGEAVQAMHKIRHFLDNSGVDMQQFYALESQLMKLIAITIVYSR